MIFHGDNNFDESFHEKNYVLSGSKRILLGLLFVEMRRKIDGYE